MAWDVVSVYSNVTVGVLDVSELLVKPSAREDNGREPRPKARAAASTIKGAGQRRNTASLLLELSARNGKSTGSLVASIRSVSIPTTAAQVLRHS